jgi:toxin ParE1/3/4
MNVRWSLRASLQFEHALQTIGKGSHAAADLYDRVMAAGDELGEFPNLGKPGKAAGTRQIAVAGTSYVLVYRLAHGTVQIAYLWHGRQRR